MPNELVVGKRRVGDFIDFYPETPLVTGTLERSDQGIGVTIHWSDPDSDHARWFTEDTGAMMRIPALPDPLPAPKRALFVDSHGPVLLIRCRPRGFHTVLHGPGSGTIWARAAILGVRENLEFDSPHGLKTEISGLRAWLGVTSWTRTHDLERSGAVTLTSTGSPVVEVGQHNGVTLQFHPSWRLVPKDGGDRWVLLDMARCVTLSERPLGWEQHRQVHRAVRDLLVLSRWRDESCVEVSASRKDDPLRTEDGKTHGTHWRDVVVPSDDRATQPTGYRPHLLRYEELQVAGILQWLRLRDEFARALDPVISSIDLRGATEKTMLAHTGPGLEALGYLLMIRDGRDEKAAEKANLHMRLNRILDDLGGCLPFDGPTWARTTAAAYNGLKHANRDDPDPVDVINAWRESVMATRAWVAIELGVPVDQVKERLAEDPQQYPYVKVE